MKQNKISPLYELLLEAFQKAAIILEKSSEACGVFTEREIKLKVDTELDLFFKDYLNQNNLSPIFSEESDNHFSPFEGDVWIIDPLDGSLNFSRRIPFYTSSIALWKNGQPFLGAVYDYSHKDFYFAEANIGSFLNGQKLDLRIIKKKNEIKAVGIPSFANLKENLEMFETSLAEYKKLRWLGCASLSLCYLATDRLDSYEEKGIKIWDVAAGLAIVKLANGNINYTKKTPHYILDVIATQGG